FIGAGDSEQRIEDSEVLPIVVIPGFVAIPQGPTARHIPAWAAGPGLRPSQNRGLKARYIVHKLLPPETRRWSRREFMYRAFSPLNVACPGPRPAALGWYIVGPLALRYVAGRTVSYSHSDAKVLPNPENTILYTLSSTHCLTFCGAGRGCAPR